MPFFKKTATDLIRIKRPTANHQQTEYTPGVVMFKIGVRLGSSVAKYGNRSSECGEVLSSKSSDQTSKQGSQYI